MHSRLLRCPNAGVHSKGRRGTQFLKEWANVYLKSAQDRLQKQIDGYTLTIEDVYTMQQMCAYEVSFPHCCRPQSPVIPIADRSHWLFQILWLVH
jgi:hypothetical protein